MDTKYTDEVEIQRQYLKQLYAYTLLLDYKLNTNVRLGVIYYAKQHQVRVVKITDEDKRGLIRDIARIKRLISSETMPKKVSQEKCGYCEVKSTASKKRRR